VLAHLQAFGRLSYDEGAAPVRTDTLYDLASLTKVVVTTTMAMILVDEGKLDIDKPVSAFLPEFRGGAKDKVTVWHLLTHSSGIDWWAPLYKELKGKDAYLQRIVAMPLAYEPGTKAVYSDLGEILLGEILERVAGEPLERGARQKTPGVIRRQCGEQHAARRIGEPERHAERHDDHQRQQRPRQHDERGGRVGEDENDRRPPGVAHRSRPAEDALRGHQLGERCPAPRGRQARGDEQDQR
jgi:hypothetical protein